MPGPEISVLVSAADFDAGKEIAALSAGRSDAVGAVATFIGLVRDEEGGASADLSVGADETSAKPETTMLQGGRAKDALCMPWTPLRGVAALRRSV